MNNKIATLVFYLSLIALSANFSYAQSEGDDFREKIEKIKLEKLVKKMELDKTTEDIFVQKYKDFNQSIRELNKKRAKIVRQIEKNLDNGEALDTLINQMLDIEQEITTQRKTYAEDLKTYLSSKQIATLIIFEKNFALELRKILKEYRKEKRENKKQE